MSQFVDQILLQLSDTTQLMQVLSPTTDTQHARLLTLLNVMYDLQNITIHDVKNITVSQLEFQRLILTTHQTRGIWTQTSPNHVQTDVVYEGSHTLEPLWLDIAASFSLKLLIEVDRGEIESVNTQSLSPVKIQLKKPLPFDPNDPANIYTYPLNLGVLVRDTIDVAATLHDVKLAATVTERVVAYNKEVDVAEVLAPYASIVIFPQAGLNSVPFKADALQSFFAHEGVLVLFMTPT